MVDFKFVVSDPKTRRSYSVVVDQDKAAGIIGKRIGEQFNGSLLGLSNYELQITGGTDKDGFPMHPSIHGPVKKKAVLSHPPGFKPKMKGQRKRKMVRGNTISRDVTQINCKVVKEGTKPLEELAGKKGEEAKPKEGE